MPINKTFRIQFETDAENEYFTRPDERGILNLYVDKVWHSELIKHLGLRDGIATLSAYLLNDIEPGDQHEFFVEIADDYIPYSLTNEFVIIGIQPETVDSDNKKMMIIRIINKSLQEIAQEGIEINRLLLGCRIL